jgi:hypothetical protein
MGYYANFICILLYLCNVSLLEKNNLCYDKIQIFGKSEVHALIVRQKNGYGYRVVSCGELYIVIRRDEI